MTTTHFTTSSASVCPRTATSILGAALHVFLQLFKGASNAPEQVQSSLDNVLPFSAGEREKTVRFGGVSGSDGHREDFSPPRIPKNSPSYLGRIEFRLLKTSIFGLTIINKFVFDSDGCLNVANNSRSGAYSRNSARSGAGRGNRPGGRRTKPVKALTPGRVRHCPRYK